METAAPEVEPAPDLGRILEGILAGELNLDEALARPPEERFHLLSALLESRKRWRGELQALLESSGAGCFPASLALRALECGYLKDVLPYMDRFEGLSPFFLDQALDRVGDIRGLFAALVKRMESISNRVGLALVRSGQAVAVATQLRHFSPLNSELAQELSALGFLRQVLGASQATDEFRLRLIHQAIFGAPDLEKIISDYDLMKGRLRLDKDLARLILASGEESALDFFFENIADFDSLDTEIAQALIGAGELERLFEHRAHFALNYEALPVIPIAQLGGHMAAELAFQVPLSEDFRYRLAVACIDVGQGLVLAERMEDFGLSDPLKAQCLASLKARGYGEELLALLMRHTNQSVLLLRPSLISAGSSSISRSAHGGRPAAPRALSCLGTPAGGCSGGIPFCGRGFWRSFPPGAIRCCPGRQAPGG